MPASFLLHTVSTAIPFALVALLIFHAPSLLSQSAACPAVASPATSPAVTAYSEGRYADAEREYTQSLSQQSHAPLRVAALVQTLLHESKIAEASARVSADIAEDSHSAPILTAQAELQLRQGQPWLAMQTLDAAAAADQCYAQI